MFKSECLMHGVYAKKGLGQHFLNDKNIAHKIVSSLKPGEHKTLIEVGPGTGILTQHLIGHASTDFIAVELDTESIAYLNTTYPDHRQQFIHADFLKYPFDGLKLPIAVIGNFPYFISSQIFFKILNHRQQVSQVVCMIQKEVAERIAAKPGNKTYGILSVFLQAYFSIEYLFAVHEKCFTPPPKVKSAVIRLIRNDTKELECNPELFFRVVKTGFNQRRKVLRNSLQPLSLNLPVESDFLTMRPEQLSVREFVELTRLIEGANG